MRISTAKVDDLALDPANVRKHPVRNLEAIKASLQKFGQQRPILVGSDGVVIAGNGTLAAARELGLPNVKVVKSDLAGVQATAYSIADNRTAELAEWIEPDLAEILATLRASDEIDHLVTGFTEEEIDFMISGATEPAVTEDEVPEPPDKATTKLGDLILLGDHRLLCGESASEVERKAFLMELDPLYCDVVVQRWENLTRRKAKRSNG